MKRVAVAMSGGVDSSVTAGLLKQQGYDVIGITLRLWEEDPACTIDNVHACCSLSSVDDAKAVASVLGIPHYTLDFRDIFRRDVIDYFVDSYVHGKTPNPCIACNKFIKFGLLWEKARQFGADFLATGHYARIEKNEATGIYSLLRGTDRRKDQSYVLYQLTQDLLPHILFPMADLEKVHTRELAKEWGLPVFNKPESQDICFIPDNDYKGFLQHERKGIFKPGDFVDKEGHVIGRHKGITHYTVGQRRGLGIAAGYHIFVKEIRPETDEIVLSREDALFSNEIFCRDLNFLSVEDIKGDEKISARVRIRYHHQGEEAELTRADDETLRVLFRNPVRAATPGQSAVFYDADGCVIGGGKIAKR